MNRARAHAGAVLAAAMAGVLFAVPVADAVQRGNIYVTYGKQRCNGGKPIGFTWAVDNFSSSAGPDMGDNVFYPEVRIGERNTISVQVICKRYGRQYMGAADQFTVKPRRHNARFRRN